jgi:hypothetical protein
LLNGYFSTAITACVFISVALGLAHPRMRSVTALGAGVLIICVILLPLVDIFSDFDINSTLDGLVNDMKYEDMSDDAIELAFEQGIAEAVAERYGTDRAHVSVAVDGFDMSALTAERIYVTLSGKAALLDYKSIEAWLVDEFTNGGECEVRIRLG